MELTPRTLDDGAPPVRPRRRRRRWLPTTVILLALAGGGLILAQGLRDATLFFRNVDEAVEQRDDLSDRRFRIQGTVEGQPERVGDRVLFPISFNGVMADVRHQGDPPELFRPGIPVVLEGQWIEGDEAVFASDRMLVRHDEEYVEADEYDDRVREADGGRTEGSDGEPEAGG